MTETKRRRVFLVGALVVAGTALSVIASGSIGENLVYYWDPTQLRTAGDDAVGPTIRLGGVVKEGTVQWKPDSTELHFYVESGEDSVEVHARAAPPAMFREGIGVVVEGTVNQAGVFESDRLMVKHSNEYRAPEEGAEMEDLYRTVEDL